MEETDAQLKHPEASQQSFKFPLLRDVNCSKGRDRTINFLFWAETNISVLLSFHFLSRKTKEHIENSRLSHKNDLSPSVCEVLYKHDTGNSFTFKVKILDPKYEGWNITHTHTHTLSFLSKVNCVLICPHFTSWTPCSECSFRVSRRWEEKEIQANPRGLRRGRADNPKSNEHCPPPRRPAGSLALFSFSANCRRRQIRLCSSLMLLWKCDGAALWF